MCEWVRKKQHFPSISMFRENAVQSYLYLVIRSVSRYHLELLVLRVKKLSQTAADLIYLSEAMPERLLKRTWEDVMSTDHGSDSKSECAGDQEACTTASSKEDKELCLYSCFGSTRAGLQSNEGHWHSAEVEISI